MEILICPVCKNELKNNDKNYCCINNHNYDISKKGYLNLLLNPDKKSNNPGDSKESLDARRKFLQQGYYDLIVEQLSNIINLQNKKTNVILDLGCGEGYYLNQLKNILANSKNKYYGIDIAKDAIMMATNYDKKINWIVANNKKIPLQDNSIDVVCALFTIVNENELKRVLKDKGIIIQVVANKKHLFELKRLVYETLFDREDKNMTTLNMSLDNVIEIKEKILINNQNDIMNLLKMTPHYYHLKTKRKEMIEQLNELIITIDISFNIYYKY